MQQPRFLKRVVDKATGGGANQASEPSQPSRLAGISSPDHRPQLRSLFVADNPESWAKAGYLVHQEGEESTVTVGSIRIRFQSDPTASGITGWEFSTLAVEVRDDSIDGIPTLTTSNGPANSTNLHHRNGAIRIDHVVVTSPDLVRTVEAFEAAGFRVTKRRDVAGTDQRQVFLWAGEAILEIVGSSKEQETDGGEGSASQPAVLWGLAITTEDMDLAVEALGSVLSEPKSAVQQGRRVATIATKKLGISVPMILLTPHISRTKAD